MWKDTQMKIALVGNPNSGKTTVFNYLTGQFKKMGNYSGVTVESVEAPIRKKYQTDRQDVVIVDLPGTFSLDAYSLDEEKTIAYITKEPIDLIFNIIDATRLEQSLHLTHALKRLGIPVIVALNKMDVLKTHNIEIDVETLEKMLECPVFCTVATHKKGIQDLLQWALKEGYDIRERRSKDHS